MKNITNISTIEAITGVYNTVKDAVALSVSGVNYVLVGLATNAPKAVDAIKNTVDVVLDGTNYIKTVGSAYVEINFSNKLSAEALGLLISFKQANLVGGNSLYKLGVKTLDSEFKYQDALEELKINREFNLNYSLLISLIQEIQTLKEPEINNALPPKNRVVDLQNQLKEYTAQRKDLIYLIDTLEF